MTILETLFGGLLLVAVIYFILRAFDVSPYWRGVASAVIPMAAYVAYSVVDWPGGEVLSMHVAVFLSTATALTLIDSRKREEGEKMHWVPKALIAFFVGLLTIQATLLYISSRGIPEPIASWFFPGGKKDLHTAFPGVVAHQQDAAKVVSSHLNQRHKEEELGWKAEVYGLESVKVDHSSEVSVFVTDAGGRPVGGAAVALVFSRPGSLEGRKVYSMATAGPGMYRAQVIVDEPGVWVAAVSVARDQGRLSFDRMLNLAPAP